MLNYILKILNWDVLSVPWLYVKAEEPSNAVNTGSTIVPVNVPALFAATVCEDGVIANVIVGGAFLTLDNVIVSVKVLLLPSESVTVAEIVTIVEFVPSAKVLPFNVTKPLAAVVDILAISEDVAVNDVIVKLVVEPLYVCETVTVEFEKASICVPVDLAETDCALFVVDIDNTGAAFLTFVKETLPNTCLLIPSESVTEPVIDNSTESVAVANVG